MLVQVLVGAGLCGLSRSRSLASSSANILPITSRWPSVMWRSARSFLYSEIFSWWINTSRAIITHPHWLSTQMIISQKFGIARSYQRADAIGNKFGARTAILSNLLLVG